MEAKNTDSSLLEVRTWRDVLNQKCEELGGIDSKDFTNYVEEKAEKLKEEFQLQLPQLKEKDFLKTA